jgi:hypothetical protein
VGAAATAFPGRIFGNEAADAGGFFTSGADWAKADGLEVAAAAPRAVDALVTACGEGYGAG